MKKHVFGRKLGFVTAFTMAATMLPLNITAVPVMADEYVADMAEEADAEILTGEDVVSSEAVAPVDEIIGEDIINDGITGDEIIGDEDAGEIVPDEEAPDEEIIEAVPFVDKDSGQSGDEILQGTDEYWEKQNGNTPIYNKNGLSVYGSGNLVYDGTARTFDWLRVYRNHAFIEPKKDYLPLYKNNINAGTATLMIRPMGNYTGAAVEVPFTIEPFNLIYTHNDGTEYFQFEWNFDKFVIIADGKVHKPAPVLKPNKWVNGQRKWINIRAANAAGIGDYKVEYTDTAEGAYKDPGVWNVKITGIGNFKGTAILPLEIKVSEKTALISKTRVTPKKMTYTYTELVTNNENGYPILNTPQVTVTDGKTVLDPSQYYTYWADQGGLGRKTLMIRGTGTTTEDNPTAYYGYTSTAVNITGTRVTPANIEVIWPDNEPVYEGDYSWSDDVRVKVGGRELQRNLEWGFTWDDITLPKGTDMARIPIKFNENYGYTGTVIVSHKVKIHDLSDFDYRVWDNSEGEAKRVTYGRSGKPDLKIMYVKNSADLNLEAIYYSKGSGYDYYLTKGVDYMVRLVNNRTVNGNAYAEITGLGKYRGQKYTIPYTTIPGDFNYLAMLVPDKTFNARIANDWMSAPKFKEVGAPMLRAGIDYKKLTADDYSYEGKESGQLSVKGTEITVTVAGLGKYEGCTRQFKYKIIDTTNDISRANFKIKDKVFVKYYNIYLNADDFTTAVASDRTTKLELDKDFEIIGYKDNGKKGMAQVTLRGKGQYGGIKTVMFRIVSDKIN